MILREVSLRIILQLFLLCSIASCAVVNVLLLKRNPTQEND